MFRNHEKSHRWVLRDLSLVLCRTPNITWIGIATMSFLAILCAESVALKNVVGDSSKTKKHRLNDKMGSGRPSCFHSQGAIEFKSWVVCYWIGLLVFGVADTDKRHVLRRNKAWKTWGQFCRFFLRRSAASAKTEQKWQPNRPQMGPIWPRGGGATENQHKYKKVRKTQT